MIDDSSLIRGKMDQLPKIKYYLQPEQINMDV